MDAIYYQLIDSIDAFKSIYPTDKKLKRLKGNVKLAQDAGLLKVLVAGLEPYLNVDYRNLKMLESLLNEKTNGHEDVEHMFSLMDKLSKAQRERMYLHFDALRDLIVEYHEHTDK